MQPANDKIAFIQINYN